MIVLRHTLEQLSRDTDFRTEILERVVHLLHLLQTINSHPFLKGKLILKGGTALNLFLFNVPRLSVDIDLNYVGALSIDSMAEERPKLDKALLDVCDREGYRVRRIPQSHAGGNG